MKFLKASIKPLIGIAIIVALVKYGGIEPKLILRALKENGHFVAMGIFLYLFLVCVAGYRWYVLLRTVKINLNFKTVFSLHMIGLFFVTILPGGTGGDVVKGFYLYRSSPEKKGLSVATIVMDRVVGFYTLLSWGMLGMLLNAKMAFSHPMLRLNALFYLGCFIGATVVILVFFSPFGGSALAWISQKKLPGEKILRSVFEAAVEFRQYPKILAYAFFLTLVVHGSILLTFYASARALGVDMTVIEHSFIVPVLTMINGLPVSPGGLGVGEAAAGALYQLVGVKEGAEILILFHFYVLISAMAGAPFYFFYKKGKEDA